MASGPHGAHGLCSKAKVGLGMRAFMLIFDEHLLSSVPGGPPSRDRQRCVAARKGVREEARGLSCIF